MSTVKLKYLNLAFQALHRAMEEEYTMVHPGMVSTIYINHNKISQASICKG